METTDEDRLLRRPEVQRLTGLPVSTIYYHMRTGSFPEPLKIGARAVAWRLSEVQAWLEARPRATGRPAA